MTDKLTADDRTKAYEAEASKDVFPKGTFYYSTKQADDTTDKVMAIMEEKLCNFSDAYNIHIKRLQEPRT